MRRKLAMGFIVLTAAASIAGAGILFLQPTGAAPDGCEKMTFRVPGPPGTQSDEDRFNRMPIDCPRGWRPIAYAD